MPEENHICRVIPSFWVVIQQFISFCSVISSDHLPASLLLYLCFCREVTETLFVDEGRNILATLQKRKLRKQDFLDKVYRHNMVDIQEKPPLFLKKNPVFGIYSVLDIMLDKELLTAQIGVVFCRIERCLTNFWISVKLSIANVLLAPLCSVL